MANPFVHIELNTSDYDAAKSFYGKLFDWQIEDMTMPSGSYSYIKVGNGTGGGMMQHPIPGSPSIWVPYIDVDDLQASTQKARELGATVILDSVDVPNMGAFSLLQDPTGAMVGIWKTLKS